jgi:hypothetical protein
MEAEGESPCSCSCSLVLELVDESSSAKGSEVKNCNPGLEANEGVGGVGVNIPRVRPKASSGKTGVSHGRDASLTRPHCSESQTEVLGVAL